MQSLIELFDDDCLLREREWEKGRLQKEKEWKKRDLILQQQRVRDRERGSPRDFQEVAMMLRGHLFLRCIQYYTDLCVQ